MIGENQPCWLDKHGFVAEPDLALFREQSLHLLEDHLAAAAELARTCGLSESELAELLRRKWEGSL